MTDYAKTSVTFVDDLPLPETNVALYRRIYVLEQWLRRIALAGLVARYGSRWNDAIPNEMARNLTDRVSSLRNRVAFNTENSDNAVWCLTLDELKALLTYEKIWPIVRTLTAFDRDELRARLDDVREIRNVIGHNRAATEYTSEVFEAIARTLDHGITTFRDRLLYDFTGEQDLGQAPNDQVMSSFYEKRSALGREHMAHDEYFYYLYVVPSAEASEIDLGVMLEHFDPVRRVILSFLVNRLSPGEYAIIWPKLASQAEHEALLVHVTSFRARPGNAYALQNPRYTCHPKIWFVY